jgi:hypothetical protein
MRRGADTRKFTGDARNPFEIEQTLNEMQPTTEEGHKELLDIVKTLEDSPNLSGEEKKALIVWKTNLLAETIEPHVKKRFAGDFYAWLLGRGRPEDVQNTPWGRQSLADDPEVRNYVDFFLDKRVAYQVALQKLAMKRPIGINQCYLYYKYLVRKGLKAGNVFEVDFMKDWDEFGKDFDKARTTGQAAWKPTGHPHEMAPYSDPKNDIATTLATEREEKNELPPNFRAKKPSNDPKSDVRADEPSDGATQKMDTEDPTPPVGGGDAMAASVDRLSTILSVLEQDFLKQKGAAFTEGMHQQYVQETTARMTVIEQTMKQQEAEYRAALEKQRADQAAAELAKLPAPPVTIAQPPSPELGKELAVLKETLVVSQKLLTDVQKSEQARIAALEQRSNETAKNLASEVKRIEAGTTQQAADIAQVSNLLVATGTLFAAFRDENTRMQEAYRQGFGRQDEFVKRLDQQQTQMSGLLAAVQESQKQFPLMIEGMKQADQASQAIIVAKAHRDVMMSANSEADLRALLQRQSQANDLIANRDLVMNYASGLAKAGSLVDDPSGAVFVRNLAAVQQRAAEATSGLPFDVAEQYIRQMAESYRGLWEHVKQQERAKAAADAKVPDHLRIAGAEQARMLEMAKKELEASQLQLIEIGQREREAVRRQQEQTAVVAALQNEVTRAREAERKAKGEVLGERIRAEKKDIAVKRLEGALQVQQQNAAAAQRAADEARQTGAVVVAQTERMASAREQQLIQQNQVLEQQRQNAVRAVATVVDNARAQFASMGSSLSAALQRETEARALLDRIRQQEAANAQARREQQERLPQSAAPEFLALPAPPSEVSDDFTAAETALKEAENVAATERKRLEDSYNKQARRLGKLGYEKMPPFNSKWSVEQINGVMEKARYAIQSRIFEAANPGKKLAQAEKEFEEAKRKGKEEQTGAPAEKRERDEPATEPAQPTERSVALTETGKKKKN